jgi:oligopeptide transport system substrate-binding protein
MSDRSYHLMIVLLLTGCGVLNHPYRETEHGKNYIYDTFIEAPKHLDPAVSYSSGEYTYIQQIYEPPFQYHYLQRPYRLIPLTSQDIPTPEYFDKDGDRLGSDPPASEVAKAIYTIRLKHDVVYQEHPCFAKDESGRALYLSLQDEDLADIPDIFDFPQTDTRELSASDYVYQIKRMADPAVACPIASTLTDYIEGFGEFAQTMKNERARTEAEGGSREAWIDLESHELEGAKVVDSHTFQIVLKRKYPQILYWLAMPFFAPIPKEADQFFAQPALKSRNLTLDNRPIGTGPYVLAEYAPNKQIVLARNENFRGETFPTTGDPGDEDEGFLIDAGKTMPFVDKAIYKLEKESIPNWNKFIQGYYDLSAISSEVFDQAVQMNETGLNLSTALEDRDIVLSTAVVPANRYFAFNMLDDVVGGYGEDRKKLRQAISIVLDIEEWIQIFLNGRGQTAQGPLPPGINGYLGGESGVNPVTHVWDDAAEAAVRRSLDDAKQLLAEAGYPNGVSKDGNPLVLGFDTAWSGSSAKARFDWIRKQFKKINIDLQIRQTDYNRFRDKVGKANFQILYWGWNADYPDSENFMFLLAGKNGQAKFGGPNSSNYDSPEFNGLFDQMESMADGPERDRLIARMIDVVREDAPWVFGFFPVSYGLYHDWYKNIKPMAISKNRLKYKRIDADRRETKREQWNDPIWWPVFVGLGLVVAGSIPAIVTVRRREQEVELE